MTVKGDRALTDSSGRVKTYNYVLMGGDEA
jgi:hypothetical protein